MKSLTNIFCDQLKNLTSILKHSVNVEQTSRGSSSNSSQEQSLVVTNRHKETRERHQHDVSYSEDSDDSDNNDKPTYKSTMVNSHHSRVHSSTAPAHKDNYKVSISDEEEINRNLKTLKWESDDNSGNDGIDDEEDDFKELAQELNKEEG